MLKIYHNPRCSKSRNALKYLQEKGLKPDIRLYIKETFTRDELLDVLKRMNIEAKDLIRTQETLYKSEYKNMNFNNDEWIDIMLENPKLIKRPIVVSNNIAIWAVPETEIDSIL